MITLGLDASTQSLTGLLYDAASGQTLQSHSINFGERLPQYKASNGYINRDSARGVEYLADPLMWLDALDLLLAELKEQKAPLQSIQRIAGTAQQHATVYTNKDFSDAISSLHTENSLSGQIKDCLSRPLSPIWMDNTTQEECDILTEKHGRDYLISSTGSVAAARFSGPQIMKFARTETENYSNTARIDMASSFLASVLSSQLAPLDFTDASGMNLLNLATNDWDQALLETVSPDLKEKLPRLAPSTELFGTISPYFVEKYGFHQDCQTCAWTGDNPASLVGMGAAQAGRIVLSLGTSYTLFAAIESPIVDPNGYGHLFGNPLGGYMALTCFSNGSLVNNHLRESLGLDWDEFNDDATPTPAPPQEINPFLVDEITPPTKANPELQHPATAQDSELIRRVLHATFENIRQHTSWIGDGSDTIYVTGGASQSTSICATIEKVFGKKVAHLDNPGSAALGAAIIASKAS